MNYEPYYSEGWKNNEEGGTPITAASLNHVDDGLLDHDEDLQNIFGDMATLEEDETASQSYAVGDYLILDGLLYKVTTAISSGGTIATGTNVTQTTVSAELGELNSDKIDYGEYNSVDLNTIKTAGMYGIQGTGSNLPSGTTFGCLEVLEYRRSVNNCYVQIFHGHNSGAYVGSFIRVSSQNGSTWSAWEKIMVKGDSIADSFTQETFSNSTTSLASKVSTEVVFSVNKSGKTAISISGITVTYPSTVWVCSFYLDVVAQKAHVYVFNNGSNAVTGVGVNCLYANT